MYRAFESAKAAGKVRFLGVSTHQNAENVLEAAIDTGWYDLAMIAVTPAGWYGWNNRQLLSNTSSLKSLKPILSRAWEAGIGLVGRFTQKGNNTKNTIGNAIKSYYLVEKHPVQV